MGLTKLGEYFEKKSINKSGITRKTGIGKNRLTRLSNDESTRLLADELYVIALALDIKPAELLEYICGHLTLEKEE
jgi:DNA-binding Xre family transcriptional regulator